MEEKIIISSKRDSLDAEFKKLMYDSELWLNTDALERDAYYKTRNGKPLEKDVFDVVSQRAVGTTFEGTIKLISKNYFPDIVANKYYGVEVKSTKDDKWTSIGSSILESSREDGVERIYMMFGKLGGTPVEFRCRPYEDVLSGVAVTHYPRYQIDMRLEAGETIFDKMKVPYDTMRKMEQPATVVVNYYKSLLKPGESALWWMGGDDIEESTSPLGIQLWSGLSYKDKNSLVAHGYALFPEIFKVGGTDKYNRFALWLVMEQGVVDTSLRDRFSAGGRVEYPRFGKFVSIPKVLGRLRDYKDSVIDIINKQPEKSLQSFWRSPIIQVNRIEQWMFLATDYLVQSGEQKNIVERVMRNILFGDYKQSEEEFKVAAEKMDIYGNV